MTEKCLARESNHISELSSDPGAAGAISPLEVGLMSEMAIEVRAEQILQSSEFVLAAVTEALANTGTAGILAAAFTLPTTEVTHEAGIGIFLGRVASHLRSKAVAAARAEFDARVADPSGEELRHD